MISSSYSVLNLRAIHDSRNAASMINIGYHVMEQSQQSKLQLGII